MKLSYNLIITKNVQRTYTFFTFTTYPLYLQKVLNLNILGQYIFFGKSLFYILPATCSSQAAVFQSLKQERVKFSQRPICIKSQICSKGYFCTKGQKYIGYTFAQRFIFKQKSKNRRNKSYQLRVKGNSDSKKKEYKTYKKK